MGTYISVNIEYKKESFSIEKLFSCLFDSSFFSPASICGCENKNFVLSGYVIEDFVYSYRRTKAQRRSIPRHVKFIYDKEAEGSKYLEKAYGNIIQASHLDKRISIFEMADYSVLATFLKKHIINNEILIRLFEKWIYENQIFHINVYGSIDLKTGQSSNLPWNSAYRQIFPAYQLGDSIGAPFLFLDISSSPLASERISISFFSQTLVWLKDIRENNFNISAEEADYNLSNLANLVSSVLQCQNSCPTYSSISLDGCAFRRELSRISEFFSGIIPLSSIISK